MKKKLAWIECVQVVRRHPDGTLSEWFDGDKKYTLLELEQCKQYKSQLEKEFPGTKYAIIVKNIQEL